MFADLAGCFLCLWFGLGFGSYYFDVYCIGVCDLGFRY